MCTANWNNVMDNGVLMHLKFAVHATFSLLRAFFYTVETNYYLKQAQSNKTIIIHHKTQLQSQDITYLDQKIVLEAIFPTNNRKPNTLPTRGHHKP